MTDYGCDTEPLLVPIDRSWVPLSENPHNQPQKNIKTNRLARTRIQDTAFKPGFEIAKLTTRLWNRSSSLLREIDTTNGL